MSTTRREYITEKYNSLTDYCNANFGRCPFPSLQYLDLSDVLYIFVQTFSPLYSSHDYRKPLRDMMNMCSLRLSDVDFEAHYPFFQKQIDELCLFLKNQK